MSITLPALPFGDSDLEPYMSARTLQIHHRKHHKAYVDNTLAMIKGTVVEHRDLDAVVRWARSTGNAKLFNNSAQAWNHAFFWRGLKRLGGGAPTGALADRINADLGGIDGFRKTFMAEATGHFGSGWTWLVARDGRLEVTSYHDGDTPLVYDGVTPLLTADVWEHAYYLDYQNARAAFIEVFLNRLVNWDAAEQHFQGAQGLAPAEA